MSTLTSLSMKKTDWGRQKHPRAEHVRISRNAVLLLKTTVCPENVTLGIPKWSAWLAGGLFEWSETCARTFFAQTFWTPPRVRDIPAKIPGHPRFLTSKPKEDKLSREGTNFSATTPLRGRPPPHRAVSGPKKLIFVLFFLAWNLNGANVYKKVVCGHAILNVPQTWTR